MSQPLYLDVHVPFPATRQLRIRGVDVLTAQDDGTTELSDPALLGRATELARALVSQDDDLLVKPGDVKVPGNTSLASFMVISLE